MAINFKDNGKEVFAKFERACEKALIEGATTVTYAIQRRPDHPVKTGLMGASWNYEPKTGAKRKITVGNTVEYSPYVEHRKHPGLKGYNDVRGDLQRKMREVFVAELN